MSDDAPEHIELIENLTEITFDPDATPGDDPFSSVEDTLLVLGRMAVRRRAAGDDKKANAVEDLIERFGPIYSDLEDELN